MGGLLIEEDLLVRSRAVDKDSSEGKKIHDFLFSRAKALVGEFIDFEKPPITFLMSDAEEPNACFISSTNKSEKPTRNRNEDSWENVKYTANPLDTPIIMITKGLIEMVDNLDQLDYVLGHELTHMIFREYGIANNSKGEETLANLHAIDLVYDAGGDPKQALEVEKKLAIHAEEQERKQEQGRGIETNKEGHINWREILDVHMTHRNSISALEASLTRISHLIDDRKPSDFDKSIFTAEYSDPVDAFLKDNNYDEQKPLDKLKILVDCIEHLSSPAISAEEFYKAKCDEFQYQLEALSEEKPTTSRLRLHDSFNNDSEDPEGRLKYKIEELQEIIEKGAYDNYFYGGTIEKKYQQKLTWLAESILYQAEREASHFGDDKSQSSDINAHDLSAYVQDKAYEYIKRNEYPKDDQDNYLDSSALIYTYFCSFNAYLANCTHEKSQTLSQIEVDIHATQKKIRTASNFEKFNSSASELSRLVFMLHDMKSVGYGSSKFDNLSSINGIETNNWGHATKMYSSFNSGGTIPWNNLVKIAQTDEKAKEVVVYFLERQGVKDLRITDDAPYIEVGHDNFYRVRSRGRSSKNKVPKYEISYALNRETVEQIYDYIEHYYANENEIFDRICDDNLRLVSEDFGSFGASVNDVSEEAVAQRKIHEFLSLYESLPTIDREKPYRDDMSALSFITRGYFSENQMPGSDEREALEISGDLTKFNNKIFQGHFGADFMDKVIDEKEAQKQRMFDAGFQILKVIADTGPEIYKNEKRVRKACDKLEEEVRELPKGAKRDHLEKEKARMLHEWRFHHAQKESVEYFIKKYLFGVFSDDNALTSEQHNILANYVVNDKTGAFSKMLKDPYSARSRYESFCDFSGVLTEQTEKVISGNYGLTNTMKIVVKNTDYEAANDEKEIEFFVEQNYKRDEGKDSKYQRYLHMFDVMRHLEKTPTIDIGGLSISLKKIDGAHGKDEQKNYERLITQSNLISLVSKAINFKKNYENLTFDKNIETVDHLIALKNQMDKLLTTKKSGRWDESEKIIVAPEHKKFLNLIDKNIRGLLRKAQYQILQQEDALERVTGLYCFYNPEEGDYKNSEKIDERKTFLDQINKNKNKNEKLSDLSRNKDFWPEDALEHIKAYVFSKNTFLDDIKFENDILNNMFDKVEQLPSGTKKNECFFILLDQNLRAHYPETRQRLFNIYSEDMLTKLGQDNGSEKYQKKLSVYLKALDDDTKKDWDIGEDRGSWSGLLSNSMSRADKYVLLKRVSDTIVSQEKTSEMMKKACQVKLNANNLADSYLCGIGVDFLTEEMDKDPNTANKLLQFLNSKGEGRDCNDISVYMEGIIREKDTGLDYYGEGYSKEAINNALENTKPINCKILYENFWSAPLEARAVIIARTLKSAVNEQPESANDNGDQQSWENVFNVVMDNIISSDDVSQESKYARDIMHSYVKSRSDYERELIMSAMMVANRNIGKDAGNVGKALKLFLENMGPAEIKLGQAIASHPDTPSSIRSELQELKNSADMPARWTLYDWIKNENVPEELWKGKHLGKVLGSASYYTTVALGEDKVLRILRPEAREKATKGFKVISGTIKDLKEKDKNKKSDLNYKELTSSVTEMVQQAAHMSSIETDHELGQKQYEDSQPIYNGVKISSGPETFTLKIMDWDAKGQNWILMDRASGPLFNDLLETTPEQKAYKKHFAKSYIVFEIMNILSGEKFDHDKHGAQLCIDLETNRVGIFDTGAMALESPTPKEQKILGHVIYDVVKSSIGNKDPLTALGNALNDQIVNLHSSNIDTRYIIEVKKGLLALGDFFKVLDQNDLKDILPDIEILSEISEHIGSGVSEKMSLADKAQIKVLMATNISSVYNTVTIARDISEVTNHVENTSVQRADQKKASWLQEAFEEYPETKGIEKNLNFEAAADDDNMINELSSF